jgi:hypothetical protein
MMNTPIALPVIAMKCHTDSSSRYAANPIDTPSDASNGAISGRQHKPHPPIITAAAPKTVRHDLLFIPSISISLKMKLFYRNCKVHAKVT